MYTPPVTPWESEMPEACDLTLISKYDRVVVKLRSRFTTFDKRIRCRKQCKSHLVMREGAVEGRLDNWGEVVTR